MERLRDVNVFVIDTESDPSTQFHPKPTSALIQIQAVHHETLSTIIIIETQFLPVSSTPTFALTQQLSNLSTFRDFSLFDLSQVTHTLNLQRYFTNHWNETHPHSPSCALQSQPIYADSDSDSDLNSDVDLVCFVNSSDIDALLFPKSVTNKPTNSTCPDGIRPYKDENNQWVLQKAISSIFDEAFDKARTMNTWSCGLDPKSFPDLPLNKQLLEPTCHCIPSMIFLQLLDYFFI